MVMDRGVCGQGLRGLWSWTEGTVVRGCGDCGHGQRGLWSGTEGTVVRG